MPPDAVSEQQDLSECGVRKACDCRDAVSYCDDLSDLLGHGLRRPCLDALLEQRYDVAVVGRHLYEGVSQLAEPSADRPVIYVGTDLKSEASRERVGFLPFERNICVIFFL